MRKRSYNLLALLLLLLAMPMTQAYAEDEAATPKTPPPAATTTEAAAPAIAPDFAGQIADSVFRTDNLWIMIAAMLVFIMHLGFATLETGLCQAKNTTNILFKNVMIVCIGLITYYIIGFNLMYPGAFNGFLGLADQGIGVYPMAAEGADVTRFYASATGEAAYTYWTDFLFQAMFAATAATIISGCVAERIKLGPFLIFAALYVGFLYPVVGSWVWGGGWLKSKEDGGLMDVGFVDFAGSTLVHSVGGWGGLAAILVLGARKGKYAADGSVRPIVGHNMPLATVGVFLLWFGWFGFNGGSALNADPATVSYVLVTTTIAAALGGFAAAMTSWVMTKKPDLTMALNGILAGLVGITAAPDTTMFMTFVTGLSAGVLVYFAVLFFDKMKIDDPVGALSVHLVCGIWGTLLAATCGSLTTQVIGIAAYGAVSFTFALVVCLGIKATLGFRVSEEEELEGLDIGEHGQTAYHALEAR